MRSATAATYEWLYQEYTADETWLCAAFVKNVRPEEALRRIGVTPSPFTGDYGFGVTAFAATGGTALVEVGWGEIVYHRADVLSAGSAAAAVAVSSDSADFTYCGDGRPITTFSLYECRSRQGAEPDRLAADLQDLGMDTDFTDPGWRGAPVAAALALAERATGVHLSPAHYAAPALYGSTEHLDPYV